MCQLEIDKDGAGLIDETESLILCNGTMAAYNCKSGLEMVAMAWLLQYATQKA